MNESLVASHTSTASYNETLLRRKQPLTQSRCTYCMHCRPDTSVH
jgi:hypothetical protein